MIPQLIKIARMYRAEVESQMAALQEEQEDGFRDHDDPQIAHWQATLEMIDQALAVPAQLEPGTRLIAATMLIALDRDTSPEPMDELGDILDELISVDVDVEGTGRTCQAVELRDACDLTELVIPEPYVVFVCDECGETIQWPHSKLNDGTPTCETCQKDMVVGNVTDLS